MTTRRSLMISGLLLIAAINPALAAKKVYRHSENGAPRSLDPLATNTTYAHSIITAVYDTLYEYKYLARPFALKPNLAAAMPKLSADGLTFTIALRQGVFFADDACFPSGKGREVIADDAIYMLKRHFDKQWASVGKWLWQDRIVGLDEWAAQGADYRQPVAGLKAVDRYTLEVKLKKPYPQFLYTLATGFAAIVPHEAVAKYGKQLALHPVGSGPWLLREFNSRKAELVRSPTYRKEVFDLALEGYDEALHGYTGIGKLAGQPLPLLDEVEISFMGQDSARWHSFTKGNEIEYATLPTIELDRVLASKEPIALKKEFAAKYQVRVAREFGFVYTEFNMSHPEIGYSADAVRNERNRALRCAIRKGFDWKARVERMYYGIGKAFPGVIPPDVEGYDPSLSRESVTLDVAGAKKLLHEHGWNASNLPVLEYTGVASVKDKQVYEQFRAWMGRIGFPKEKVKYTTFATNGDYSRAIKEGHLMTHSQGWSLDYPDAENTLQLYYGPNKSPGSNSSHYQNARYDSLYARATVMRHGAERTALYRQANEILVDDCVVIAGFARTMINLWHKNVVMYPEVNVIGNYFKYIATNTSDGVLQPLGQAAK